MDRVPGDEATMAGRMRGLEALLMGRFKFPFSKEVGYSIYEFALPTEWAFFTASKCYDREEFLHLHPAGNIEQEPFATVRLPICEYPDECPRAILAVAGEHSRTGIYQPVLPYLMGTLPNPDWFHDFACCPNERKNGCGDYQQCSMGLTAYRIFADLWIARLDHSHDIAANSSIAATTGTPIRNKHFVTLHMVNALMLRLEAAHDDDGQDEYSILSDAEQRYLANLRSQGALLHFRELSRSKKPIPRNNRMFAWTRIWKSGVACLDQW